VRPSYVEVSEVPTEQLNLKKVAKNKAASDATGKKKPVTAE
jgi:hypothetical protein